MRRADGGMLLTLTVEKTSAAATSMSARQLVTRTRSPRIVRRGIECADSDLTVNTPCRFSNDVGHGRPVDHSVIFIVAQTAAGDAECLRNSKKQWNGSATKVGVMICAQRLDVKQIILR
jgi:hypothetical protein